MNSKYYFWTITLVISSFLFGCTTAMNLDTNGYTTRLDRDPIKYCQHKLNERMVEYIPCDEVKHDQSI